MRFLKQMMAFLCLMAIVPGSQAQSPYRVVYNEATVHLLPLVKEAYHLLNIDVEFVLMPQERALIEVNSGRFDASLSRVAGIADQYPNLLYSRQPLQAVRLYGFIKQQNPQEFEIETNMKHYIFGHQRGSKISESYIEKSQPQAMLTDSLKSLYSMLDSGRFDIALISSSQLSSDAQQGYLKFKRLPYALMVCHSYHVFNKKHAGLITAFDEKIARLRAQNDEY